MGPAVATSSLGPDWGIGLAASLAVVLLVAALLLGIWSAAKGILAGAVGSLGAVQRIRRSTDPLFALTTTNEVAAGILAAAGGIARDATSLAAAFEATEHPEGGL